MSKHYALMSHEPLDYTSSVERLKAMALLDGVIITHFRSSSMNYEDKPCYRVDGSDHPLKQL